MTLFGLMSCDVARRHQVEIQVGKCWPKLAIGDHIHGVAEMYILTRWPTDWATIESDCEDTPDHVPTGVYQLMFVEIDTALPREYDALKRVNDKDYDVLGWRFPVEVDGYVMKTPPPPSTRVLSLDAKRITRIGPIEFRRISQLRSR